MYLRNYVRSPELLQGKSQKKLLQSLIASQPGQPRKQASKVLTLGKKRREENDTSPLTQWDCWLRYSFTQQESKIGMEEDFFSPKLATNGATFTKSYADGGYAGKLIDWAKLTWDSDLEIVKRA